MGAVKSKFIRYKGTNVDDELLDETASVILDLEQDLPLEIAVNLELQPEPSTVEECSICLEELDPPNKITYLPCQHRFHEDCVDDWLLQNNTCPMCREKVPKKRMKTIEMFKEFMICYSFIIVPILITISLYMLVRHR